MEKTALLICSGGASSGFLAQNIRKAAKKRGMEIEVIARGESELREYMNQIDVVLIAPHLSYIQQDIEQQLNGSGIPCTLIDPSTYGLLDGEKGLDIIIHQLEEK
ncbi:PTS sugar transporter subunit IIB [Agaribacter marinus]|uniref:PTS sugar transporter subunit IIB n=1 Tax=Virgibacillus salarius TaxID=447199 RepID=A0A941DXT0_9BACI|nr:MULTISPECIES: PTS sugar transporter subunit IIB [Bacillaceae]MBR7796123.1 PTS sugar transporter subunit IIB [Virgibacillus salarius]NAZ08832.1 PTS sugar transporter subunit IIB [Agaribacter marinus]WBX81489.1 PTS sugar transporter subunit IIB [Virgibacillus salarius]